MVVGGDEPLARVLRHRLEDRIEVEQRIVREVHLGHEPRREGRSHQREVDVSGPPSVVMVPPRIGARLDGDEPVLAVRVRAALPDPEEVRVERGGEVDLAPMHVPTARVRLPDLDQRVGHRRAVLVEHPPGDDRALPDRLAAGARVRRQVGVLFGEIGPQWPGTGDFRQRLHQGDERHGRRPRSGALVVRVEERRMVSVSARRVGDGHRERSTLASCSAWLAAGTPA